MQPTINSRTRVSSTSTSTDAAAQQPQRSRAKTIDCFGSFPCASNKPSAGRLPPPTFLNPHNTADVQQTATVLANSFIEREPMVKALRQTNDEAVCHDMRQFSLALTQTMASHGMTAIQKDREGRVVALCMAEPHDSEWPELPESLAPVGALLGTLGENFQSLRQNRPEVRAQPKKTLHLAMVGAAAEAEGTGAARRATLAVVRRAVARHYDDFMTEATSRSQDILAKRGFKELHHVDYGSFQSDEGAPFASIDTFKSAKLMWAPTSTLVPWYGRAWMRCTATSADRNEAPTNV